MTEDEWLAEINWQPMVKYLKDKGDKRKWTLYVCAGLRSIWELLYDESSRQAVEVAERAADGDATKDEISYASWSAESATFGCDFDNDFIRSEKRNSSNTPSIKRLVEMGVYTEEDLISSKEYIGDREIVNRLSHVADIAYHVTYQIKDQGVGDHLIHHLINLTDWPGGWLVREIFGNPFQPAVDATPWQTETVLAIARKIYAERTFELLPILADALEEAGCDSEAMLQHLRGPGPHFLGCWALDTVLGKKVDRTTEAYTDG
jgi:hypothetical protein